MAVRKKSKKQARTELQDKIEHSLQTFAEGISSKRLEKKLKKASAELAELIQKLSSKEDKKKNSGIKKKKKAKPVKKKNPVPAV